MSPVPGRAGGVSSLSQAWPEPSSQLLTSKRKRLWTRLPTATAFQRGVPQCSGLRHSVRSPASKVPPPVSPFGAPHSREMHREHVVASVSGSQGASLDQ